jgi:hypothetical protein
MTTSDNHSPPSLCHSQISGSRGAGATGGVPAADHASQVGYPDLADLQRLDPSIQSIVHRCDRVAARIEHDQDGQDSIQGRLVVYER